MRGNILLIPIIIILSPNSNPVMKNSTASKTSVMDLEPRSWEIIGTAVWIWAAKINESYNRKNTDLSPIKKPYWFSLPMSIKSKLYSIQLIEGEFGYLHVLSSYKHDMKYYCWFLIRHYIESPWQIHNKHIIVEMFCFSLYFTSLDRLCLLCNITTCIEILSCNTNQYMKYSLLFHSEYLVICLGDYYT